MKHTAAYFERKIQRIKNQIATKKTFLEKLEKILNANPENSFEEGEQWNKVYDEIRKLENKIHNIEFQRDTQNWDCQDWTQYNLACDNID